MKTICLWFVAAAMVLATPPLTRAQEEISVDFFYDHLEPYGYWLEVGDYGYCWQPADVDEDWRPYSDGSWVYTDAGWTWQSYEPFGWAVYHYGRWANIEEVGWVWIPGTEWGPGWVAWRHSPQYVGWAPLPPEATFIISIGFRSWVDDYYDIGPSSYRFVENRHFGSRRLRDVFVDRSQNLTIINQTTNITNITYVNNVVYNGGPRYDQQSRQSVEPIHRYRLDRRQRFDGDPRRQSAEHFQSRVEGDSLSVVAVPFGRHGSDRRPEKIRERVERPEIDRGWRGVGSPTEIADMRSHLRSKSEIPKELPSEPRFEREGDRRGPEGAERPTGRADAPPMREKGRGDRSSDSDQPPTSPPTRPGATDRPPSPGDRPDRENGKGMVRPGGTDRPPSPGDRPDREDGKGTGRPGDTERPPSPGDRPVREDGKGMVRPGAPPSGAPGAGQTPDRPREESPKSAPGAGQSPDRPRSEPGSTRPAMPSQATERPKSEEPKSEEPKRPEATKRPEPKREETKRPEPRPGATKRPEPKREEMKRPEPKREAARPSSPKPVATKRSAPKPMSMKPYAPKPVASQPSAPKPVATKRPEPKREEARRSEPKPSAQRRPEAKPSKPGSKPPSASGSSGAKQTRDKDDDDPKSKGKKSR